MAVADCLLALRPSRRLLVLRSGQLIACLGHAAERQPPAVRVPLPGDGRHRDPPERRAVCFNLAVIVDGSYWVGRRAYHFDQRCC